MPFDHPPAPSADVVGVLHGEEVADPYRPLEALDDPATRRWVHAENELTERYLSASRARSAIRDRVAELWDHPRVGAPVERGGHWFQLRNSGLQPQAVLYVADSPTGGGRPLIDPNAMSQDGTVSLAGLGFSTDGGLVAYATSYAGSDWMTWRVRETSSCRDLGDVLEWSKFSSVAWNRDGSGFFYAAVDRPHEGAELTQQTRSPRILFHRLGTEQPSDTVEFSATDEPDWLPSADVTGEGGFLVVTVQRGTGSETSVLVRDLQDPESCLVQLNTPFESKDLVVGGVGDDLVVLTDRGAERGRLVLARPGEAPGDWREILPEEEGTLVDAYLYGGHLVCHYLRHACSALAVYSCSGAAVRDIPVPGPVSLTPGPTGASVEGRVGSSIVHFEAVSFVESGAVWSHDLETGRTTLVSRSTAAIDPDRFETEQVFARSADGTPIPMFLTRPAGMLPDRSARVLLYGYGGFGVPLTPAFSVTFAAWLDRGGMVAVANLRGGGEYGRQWHEAGRLRHKQNVFDDFCACASWLAESGWSSAGSTAINGGSNGGLLVGACLIQRPELFGAAVVEVGVLDMLRFHLFTIGWAWRSDYGDPDDGEQFRWLRAYSPLHNIRSGDCYPPTLIMTGDHDDRVVPAHSYKFAAALQAAQGCDQPILLRVSTSAGHGAGKPTAKLIDEATDRITFLEMALGRS